MNNLHFFFVYFFYFYLKKKNTQSGRKNKCVEVTDNMLDVGYRMLDYCGKLKKKFKVKGQRSKVPKIINYSINQSIKSDEKDSKEN